jgi:hypothetical protein
MGAVKSGLAIFRSGKMSFKLSLLCAASVLALMGASAHAGLVKNAGKASTSNVTTSTPGQHSILMTIDPYDLTSFQLSVSFEASKVQFVSITGLNGFIVDDFSISTVENSGLISGIHGFFPGFDDREPSPGEGTDFASVPDSIAVPGLPTPPAGEVDIFQIVFTDLRPDLDKTFGVFAGPTDYINGFDPDTGGTTQALGPVNSDGFGVAPAFSTVPGIPNGGGNSVPLPGALMMGLLGGAGVLANVVRRRRA